MRAATSLARPHVPVVAPGHSGAPRATISASMMDATTTDSFHNSPSYEASHA
jgi:hypothetical protein